MVKLILAAVPPRSKRRDERIVEAPSFLKCYHASPAFQHEHRHPNNAPSAYAKLPFVTQDVPLATSELHRPRPLFKIGP
jgi:hypothetical protein